MPVKTKQSKPLFKSSKVVSLKQMILFVGIFLFFNTFCERAFSETNRQEVVSSVLRKASLSLFLSELNSSSVSKKGTSSSVQKKYDGSPESLIKDEKENKKFKKKRRKVLVTNTKKKRKLASQAYSCSETFQDQYSAGYVRVGYSCEPGAELCISFHHIERNRCDGDDLIRYYCDPQVESLFSFKTIQCPKGCHFSGLSGSCIR